MPGYTGHVVGGRPNSKPYKPKKLRKKATGLLPLTRKQPKQIGGGVAAPPGFRIPPKPRRKAN